MRICYKEPDCTVIQLATGEPLCHTSGVTETFQEFEINLDD